MDTVIPDPDALSDAELGIRDEEKSERIRAQMKDVREEVSTMLSVRIPPGDLDLKKILESRYFFSWPNA